MYVVRVFVALCSSLLLLLCHVPKSSGQTSPDVEGKDCGQALSNCDGDDSVPPVELNLIPRPQQLNFTEEAAFAIDPALVIVTTDPASGGMTGAEMLQREIARLYSLTVPIVIRNDMGPTSGCIILSESDSAGSDPESYRLEIAPDRICVQGADRRGTFYGVQTLIQIMRDVGSQASSLPSLQIDDWPNYNFRGMHLLSVHPDADTYASSSKNGCAPMDWLESEIAMMAHLKMNVLLWGINCGVAYDKFPELSRSYTQSWDRARQVVDLGRKYHIEVIPAFNSSSRHSNWMKPYDLMIDSDLYNESLHAIVDQIMEIFYYPRYFLGGLDEGTRSPASYLTHINRMRGWLAPYNTRLMVWGDRFLSGVGWPQEPVREPGQTVEQWAQQYITSEWRTALDNLDDDVIICNWRYASRTFETAEYLNWKQRDQVGATWSPGGILDPWFSTPEPWCLNFAQFGHTFNSSHFLGMTGTTWYPFDRNFVRSRIIHSADAFWSPAKSKWNVAQQYDPRLINGITEPYTKAGYTIATPIPILSPPASKPHVVVGPVVPDLSTALAQLKRCVQTERTQAYISLARIGGDLPLLTLMDSAQTTLDKKMAFWVAERMELSTEKSKRELWILATRIAKPQVVRWATNRLATMGIFVPGPAATVRFNGPQDTTPHFFGAGAMLSHHSTPYVLPYVFYNAAEDKFTYVATNTTGTNPTCQGGSNVVMEKLSVHAAGKEYYYYVTSDTRLISLAEQKEFIRCDADLFRVDKWYNSASPVTAPAGYPYVMSLGMTTSDGASNWKFVLDGNEFPFSSEKQVHLFCQTVDPAQSHTIDFRYVSGPFGCSYGFSALIKAGPTIAVSEELAQQETIPPWSDENWQYRRSIDLALGQASSEIPVILALDLASALATGRMADANDFYVADSGGNTPLSCQAIGCPVGDTRYLQITVPAIAAEGAKTFFFYYNLPQN